MSRLRTHSDPGSDDGCEADRREEVDGELVIAGSDTPEVLEPTEGGLDAPAVAVAPFIILDWALARPAAWDDGLGTGVAETFAQGIGIVAAVGNQPSHRLAVGEQRLGHPNVGDVPAGERERDWPAQDIGQGVDPGRLAAAGASDRLHPRPPLWNGPPLLLPLA